MADCLSFSSYVLVVVVFRLGLCLVLCCFSFLDGFSVFIFFSPGGGVLFDGENEKRQFWSVERTVGALWGEGELGQCTNRMETR